MAAPLPSHVVECLDSMRGRSAYRRSDTTYGLTLSFLERQDIALEGVPSVGKTTLMHSIAHVLTELGEDVVPHEESRDQAMLDEFARDPKQFAFWFQMYKLGKRQQLCHELESQRHTNAVHILDRTLPGDMAFALYNYVVGNFTDQQFRAYMTELTKVVFRKPFLLMYFTASPETLVARVKGRGYEFEIATYDKDYFIRMDVCYRVALEMMGCNYCVINWDASLPGIAVPGNATVKPLIPRENVMQLLETAIKATYNENIRRISDMRVTSPIDANAVLFPGSKTPLRTSDPEDLVAQAHSLLKKSGAFGDNEIIGCRESSPLERDIL